MTGEGWSVLATALADRLVAEGHLPASWRGVFASVPRHVFVPDHPVAKAYSDEPIVTQTRSVKVPGGGSVDLSTSSASAPAAVAVMLDRLDVAEGMRVLEIGTGTGYNAALLCDFLGADNVYSTDIDPALVERARTTLGEVGFHPFLAAADGYVGLSDAEPFDRIVATAAISHVPPAWIRQLAPDGRIVAPLLGGSEAALAVLTKSGDDEVTGYVDSELVAFMPLRREVNNPLPAGHAVGYTGSGIPHYGRTALNPTILRGAAPDLLLFVHLHIPGVDFGTAEGPDGVSVTVSSPEGEATAPIVPVRDGAWTVKQRGRRLWDTVEHAVRLWYSLGEPDRTRLGITALDRVDRQFVWLDDPDGAYSWPLPM